MKFLIRRLKGPEAADLATFALTCDHSQAIRNRCRELATAIAHDLFETPSTPDASVPTPAPES